MREDVRVGVPTWSLDAKDWTWFDGNAIPSPFTVPVTSPRWSATIDVEVVDGKARTRAVTVTTGEAGGVTYAMMQEVPIRPAVARGALHWLRRPVVTEDGTTKLRSFTMEEEAEARVALKRLVGYVDSSSFASSVLRRLTEGTEAEEESA